MTNRKEKIRVLIADDSLTGRKLLAGILSSNPEFEISGTATNGKEAVELAKRLQPDIISMDINMPILDGIEATKLIMSENPIPVVIVSSIYNESNVIHAIEELEAGAVTVLPKPHGPGHSGFARESQKYINTMRLMSELKVVRRAYKRGYPEIKTELTSFNNSDNFFNHTDAELVVIGSSAGGPEALKQFLGELIPDFPLPIIIVQHLDPHFVNGFLAWMNSYSPIPAKIAENGEVLLSGNIYLPSADTHITVTPGKIEMIKHYTKERVIYKPSIDILFESVAKFYGKKAIGIIFSGMGNDGAKGLKQMKERGAYTFAQDKESSLIYGMPQEAFKCGATCRIMTPSQIASQLNLLFK